MAEAAYVASMLSAALGYFLFTGFWLGAVDADRSRIASRHPFGLVNRCYALVLAPSALWMPLTFLMLERPNPGLWLAIRIVLALVGLGSLGLLWALLRLQPRRPALPWALAVAGSAAFCLQTAVLDAIVWPAYFP